MQPVIGVSSSLGLARSYDPPREQNYLLTSYTDAVHAAGGIPHALPVYADYDESLLDSLLGSVHALMLTGGLDLDPRRWGEPRHPQTKVLPERRERFEIDLFRRADARQLPIFAICLGFQVVHVARGGRLAQHVDDLGLEPQITHHLPGDRNAFHAARVAPGSRLAQIMGTTEPEVNSRHHQIVPLDGQGAGLRPVAYAPDGVLEASEDCDGRFLLAVQWHPEDLVDRPEHLRLFQALVAAAAT